MERTYKLSFIGYITIHVLAILFFLLLAFGSSHRINFDLKDYLIFAHPVLTVLSMIALKVLKGRSKVVSNIIRIALGLLLMISLYLVIHVLFTFYEENLDIAFMVISHLVLIAFFALNFIVLFGLIKQKI